MCRRAIADHPGGRPGASSSSALGRGSARNSARSSASAPGRRRRRKSAARGSPRLPCDAADSDSGLSRAGRPRDGLVRRASGAGAAPGCGAARVGPLRSQDSACRLRLSALMALTGASPCAASRRFQELAKACSPDLRVRGGRWASMPRKARALRPWLREWATALSRHSRRARRAARACAAAD